MRVSIELDMCVEDDGTSDAVQAQAWGAAFGCDAQVVTPCGPAGGNPVVRLTGERADVERLVADYEGGGDKVDAMLMVMHTYPG